MTDLFNELFKGIKPTQKKERTREDDINCLRHLEKELREVRKEIFKLRRELGVD